MIYYILIFLFQLLFNIFKVLEIKYTYENKIIPLLFNSVWINLISLTTVFFSMDRLFHDDFLIIPFYILGSVIGKWIAMVKFSS